eukprot:g5061.t1
MLDPTELDCFSSLSSEHKSTVFSISCIGDYEVAFYLNKFAKTKEDVMDSNTLRVKNRRLAELDRLIAEGEYFGDTAMRDREPLLFQQYIAKFSQNLLSGQPRKPKSLSESLIQSAEEQELQERLNRATAAAEEEEEKEEEEDEEFEEIEDEEFMRQEFVQIMKERFLTGKDGDYVDYNRIDNDACLDDDLLGIENQDKEEKYFQSDE